MSKLVFAVLHLGKSKLEVVAEEGKGGKRRKVDLSWRTKSSTDIPPKNWPSLVASELSFQDSNRFPV